MEEENCFDFSSDDDINQKLIIGKRLKDAIKLVGLTQKQFIKNIGMPLPSLREYLSGRQVPGGNAITLLIHGGINANWLLTGEGEPLISQLSQSGKALESSKLQIINSKEQDEAGLNKHFVLLPMQSDFIPSHFDQQLAVCNVAFRSDWLLEKGLQIEHLVMFQMRGDSMVPTIEDGDMVLVDKRINRLIDDSIYMVQTDSNLVVKRLQQSLNGTIHVISDNKRYADVLLSQEQSAQVKIAGRVCWFGHQL